ncbi:polysaccharide pyruvyl transferase family protein [Novosphingobium soli]|uniref:polysaccharide pyruvyl transferase family protein n=1 Tax=Novosphingobium soli TaxID=574956 RepID=UPI003631B7B5
MSSGRASAASPTWCSTPACSSRCPPARAPGEEAPYLALYGHGFPSWFAAAVRRWARDTGRRIVSIGYRCDWADEQRIDVGPEEFPAVISGADAVATNFFHGCVFALHYARPFVCAPSAYRFNKVRDLTRLLGAERHRVEEGTPPDTFAAMLEAPLAPDITRRIEALRQASRSYLDRALA